MVRLGRRDLLRMAAGAGLAMAARSLPGWISSGSVDAAPSRAAWQSLRQALRGRLLLPGEAAYAAYPGPFNLRYASVRPAGIVLCASPDDIAAAVRWARPAGLIVAARAGGHSYGGYSTTRGLLVDVSRLKHAAVGDGVASFGAGIQNRDAAAVLQAHRVAIPSGRCPTVGLSGLLLGGGFGFSSRRYGLMSDSLLETHTVTPDGAVRTCNARENADLFWACRGGGGGNFGINLDYKLRTFPVGTVSVFKLVWAWADAAAALHAIQAAAMRAPDGFSFRVGASVNPRGRSVVAIGQHFGPREDLLDVLAPVLSAAKPGTQIVIARHYWDAYDYLALNEPKTLFANRSEFLDRPLPDAAIATALRWLERWPGASGGAGVSMFTWGGAINRVAPAATAFVHRDKHFLFQMEADWGLHDAPSVVGANRAWVNDVYSAMRPSMSGGAYQNFIDPELQDWPQTYYGTNLSRLRQIKRKYDPDNLFRFPQGIPPA